jgi:WXG100 family type VII secretion target
MTDAAALVANPDAIRDFGTTVGRQYDPLHAISQALADGEIDPHAFGKLPEAKAFHHAYAEHAVEVRRLAAQLPAHVSDVKEGLHATASWYDSVHEGLSAGMLQVAADAEADCEAAYAWTDESESPLPRLGDKPQKKHGLAGLIDEAIEWTMEHVPELPELLDKVTGDYEALRDAAEVWHEQAEALNDVIHELRKEGAELHEKWHGDGAANFGEYMASIVQGLSELADVMGQTQTILDDAAREASAVHRTIVTILRTVVEWVAGNIIVDVLVVGTATVLEAAGAAAFLAEKVAEAHAAASSLAGVYSSLLTVVQTLQEAKAGMEAAQGLGQLAKFLAIGWDFNHALELGRITQVGTVLHAGQDVGWLAGRVVRTSVGMVALKGIGGVGLAKTLGEEVGKDAFGASAKDIVTGKVHQAGKDFKQRVGLQAPPLPEAAPIAEIEALLNGEKKADEPPTPEELAADEKENEAEKAEKEAEHEKKHKHEHEDKPEKDTPDDARKPSDDDKPYTGALY